MAKISLFDGTLVRIGNEIKRFDRGAEIPDYADGNHVQLLVDRGMVGDGDPVVGVSFESAGPAPFDVDADAKASNAKSAKAAT